MAAPAGTALMYVRTETRTRCQALASMEGRTVIEYLDRLLRHEVSKIDPIRYNAAIEKVTTKGLDNG